MKKPYEDPVLIIELFPGQDIIAFSMGGGSGDEGGDDEEPSIGFGYGIDA